ncbi:phosphonate C-P lyase system protein PhnH [Nonomuraea diastatica]|nr:phosphonate C-P lyase system protein PhnH [Nonomuraea diastatica]
MTTARPNGTVSNGTVSNRTVSNGNLSHGDATHGDGVHGTASHAGAPHGGAGDGAGRNRVPDRSGAAGAVRGIGAHVRAVTPTAAQAQADFRALLNVLSRPGVLDTVKRADGPAALAVAAGLADVEVPTSVLTPSGEEHWAQALHLATSAPPAPPETARMVVALRPPSAAEIASLTRGDALHPEHGTRLIAAVETLTPHHQDPGDRNDHGHRRQPGTRDHDDHQGNGDRQGNGGRWGPSGGQAEGVVLVLRGPGVPGVRRVRVTGLPAGVFAALAEANADFPAGVDTFLVAQDGTIAGLPRSTRIEIENGDA